MITLMIIALIINSLRLNDAYINQRTGGRFKNTYELLNLRALKFSTVNKIHIFQFMSKILCVVVFIWPIYWNMRFLYSIEILRALIFKSIIVRVIEKNKPFDVWLKTHFFSAKETKFLPLPF